MFYINDGIASFNNADFFAAHDFFENLWMEAKKEDKLFFQGMVQISVGYYHFICGNLKGSKSQLIKGTSKLKLYEPLHYKINISNLVDEIEKFCKTNFEIKKLNNIKIDSIVLPKIKLLTNVKLN